MIVGEAPGKNEDLQGEPFVGRGGKLLDKIFTVTLEELQKDHGLLVAGSWEHLHMSDEQKNYIKLLLKMAIILPQIQR